MVPPSFGHAYGKGMSFDHGKGKVGYRTPHVGACLPLTLTLTLTLTNTLTLTLTLTLEI